MKLQGLLLLTAISHQSIWSRNYTGWLVVPNKWTKMSLVDTLGVDLGTVK